ncbi:hypothetical protein [Nostoc sp.]|uniref:hypothetical protein n=1 Tax=Nostoc sp. TaxID=1180 RepID=UPI002FFBF0EE
MWNHLCCYALHSRRLSKSGARLQWIIQHRFAKDDPEHLRTIRERLFFNEHRAGRLLGLYQRLLQAEEIEGTELTTLRGHTAAIREIAGLCGYDNTLILWNLQRILNLDAPAYGCTLVENSQDLRKNSLKLLFLCVLCVLCGSFYHDFA